MARRTVHTSTTSAREKSDHITGVKPACVLKYNKMIEAVYKADIMKGFVECARKTIKGHNMIFFYLIDTAVLNSRI